MTTSAGYHADKLKWNRVIWIVLTIAHLDHDVTNNDPRNLRALCQRCHNLWDAKHRAESRRKGNRQ